MLGREIGRFGRENLGHVDVGASEGAGYAGVAEVTITIGSGPCGAQRILESVCDEFAVGREVDLYAVGEFANGQDVAHLERAARD